MAEITLDEVKALYPPEPDGSAQSPPTIAPLAPPAGRGQDAAHWLDMNGLPARIPCLRSSDERYLDSPFTYYLERRLGITSAFSGETFSHGDWVHHRAAFLPKPNLSVEAHMADGFKKWTALAALAAPALDISTDALKSFIEPERLRMQEAWAWYEAACKVQTPGLPGGIAQLVREPDWRMLATEYTIAYKHPGFAKTRIVIKLDRLAFHLPTKTLWIDDYKTEAGPRTARAERCTIEHQTRTYLIALNGSLQEIIKAFALPPDTRVGGMRHIIIAKPAIRFGMNDRTYRWVSEGKRTGISGSAFLKDNRWWVYDGTVAIGDFTIEEEAVERLHALTKKKPEKEHSGEPDITLYSKRVENWYLARGDYAGNAVDFSTDPPVLVSETKLEAIDADAVHEWTEINQILYKWATIHEPRPCDYFRTATGMKASYSPKPSPMADFHILPVHRWPAIMKRNLLVVRPRELEHWFTANTGPLE